MMKRNLLFLILLVSTCGYAQTQLRINLATKYQPTNWSLHSEDWPINRDTYEFWPVLEAELGIRKYFDRSNWFIDAGISFRHTRQIFKMNDLNFPNEIDPFYAFVYETAQYSFIDYYNYIGLKLGSGYRFDFKRSNNALLLPMGVQAHVPVLSHTASTFNMRDTEYPLYKGESFKSGVYYGIYFQPGFEFALSRKRSNPWRFSIYAETDVLIHNESEIIPKFLWGGGLGVSYRIGGNML